MKLNVIRLLGRAREGDGVIALILGAMMHFLVGAIVTVLGAWTLDHIDVRRPLLRWGPFGSD